MATTRISDVVVPEVFSTYLSKDSLYTAAIWNTGVIRTDGDLSAKLAGGARTFNVPFWKDLDDDEPDNASDDPNDVIVPGKLSSGTDIARRQIKTKAWSSADLSAELAGADPMARIGSRAAAYWGRQYDQIAINTIRGVINSNVSNNSGDMVNDISTDGAGAVTSAELFSADAVLDTAQTMGDKKTDLKVLAMHSVVQTRLAKNDLIDYRPDSESKVMHPYFMDYRVLVSDNCPAIAGTNRTRYHTYLLGANALGWGEAAVDMPVEVDREAKAGGGMGVETLITRRQFALHPYGIKWTDASCTEEFPSYAELRLSANWSRVYADRKMIPISVLITNG